MAAAADGVEGAAVHSPHGRSMTPTVRNQATIPPAMQDSLTSPCHQISQQVSTQKEISDRGRTADWKRNPGRMPPERAAGMVAAVDADVDATEV